MNVLPTSRETECAKPPQVPATGPADCSPLPNSEIVRWSVAKPACLGFLLAATLFGFQVAQWTRWDRWPNDLHVTWPILFGAHVSVLGLWTIAWGLCWRNAFDRRGGQRVLVAVAISAAFLAEGLQVFMPGHRPDLGGLSYNLIAVTTALWLGNRILSAPKAASIQHPAD